MRLDVRGVAVLITGVPTLLSFTFTNWSLDCAGASQPAWLTQCVRSVFHYWYFLHTDPDKQISV